MSITQGAIGLGIIGICLALLGFFCTGDLFYACCRNKYNSKLLIKTIDKGNRPGTGVSNVKFFPRTEIVELLERILQPDENQSHYYLICGEHGTGKTTVVRTASSIVDHGVVYVDIPARNENLGVAFRQALNFAFEERISFTNQLIRKLGSTSNDSDEPMWRRALEAFKRGAKVYKAKRGRPAPVDSRESKILDTLQDDAKKNADDQIYIAVFVSSEGAVPRRMKSRSSWSRAKNPPIEIGDLSEEESIKYLTEIHKITEKAEELYQLVGGRILELKDVANDFSSGQSIEDIGKKILLKAYDKFNSAKLLKDQEHHEAGKRVINALLGSKESSIEEFKELFANEKEYGKVLEANVFAFHPSRNT
ncbi:8902_t:CDS:2, partial [Diversispora eburnea]